MRSHRSLRIIPVRRDLSSTSGLSSCLKSNAYAQFDSIFMHVHAPENIKYVLFKFLIRKYIIVIFWIFFHLKSSEAAYRENL